MNVFYFFFLSFFAGVFEFVNPGIADGEVNMKLLKSVILSMTIIIIKINANNNNCL
jgi:hypothetical protein